MDRSDIIEREMENLDRLANSYMHQVERELREIRKDNVNLFLNQKDKYRLLTLRVWSDKYKVDLKFILSTLVPFWEKFIQRRSKKMKQSGLNVRVSTLTGNKSEEILQDSIKRAFPNGENKILWVAERREEIIQHYLTRIKKISESDGVHSRSDPSRLEDETGRILNITDFSTPGNYLKYYRKWIRREQLAREKVQTEMRKRNFRNNPFRSEYI